MVSCQRALPDMLTHGRYDPFGRIPSMYHGSPRGLVVWNNHSPILRWLVNLDNLDNIF